jgi:hypothetical protein
VEVLTGFQPELEWKQASAATQGQDLAGDLGGPIERVELEQLLREREGNP